MDPVEPYTLRRSTTTRITLRMAPDGTLRVSAPWYVARETVDRFVASQGAWIEAHRAKLSPGPGGMPGQVLVWGQPWTLEVVSPGRLPRVVFDQARGTVTLRVPASWDGARRRRVLDRWEKDRVEAALAGALPRWEAVTGLQAARWTVKRLRSRWGSCQPATRSLVFNARLGALPPACLDYVVVHELAHLVEPSHNARFHALVDRWFPGAREARALLRSAGRDGPGAFPDPDARPGAGTEPPGPR